MLAKTLYGLEPVLANELRKLGASGVTEGTRSVTFYGDMGFMYKANLCCRTAIKILKPVASFPVFSEEDLYNKVKQYAWEEHMHAGGRLAIDATVHSQQFTHSKYIALKTKDAICDRFREIAGSRPDVDLDHPTLRVNVHIDRNRCNLSLDSSGASLHKRGYKVATTIAPINEVLAAGIIMLAGWNGQCDLLDPMCGGGTLLTEAAMIACNIPPNLNRKEFGFELWPDFDVDLFETIEAGALKRIIDFKYKIQGYDLDAAAIKKAKENVASANLKEFVTVSQEDFFKTSKESDGPSFIIFNPPYDERIAVNTEELYSNIGTTLKHAYPGTQVWMITSNMEALKYVGLRPSRKIKLFNGKLESKLVCYHMYEGSKKAKKQ